MAEEPMAQQEIRQLPGASGDDADLARQLSALSSVFDATPVAMAAWSVEGRLLRANAVFSDLVGVSGPRLAGRRFDTFVDPADADRIRRRARGPARRATATSSSASWAACDPTASTTG